MRTDAPTTGTPAPLKIACGLRPMVRYRRADTLAWISSNCPRVDGKGGTQ